MPPNAPNEQLSADFGFQIAYLPAEGGLTDLRTVGTGNRLAICHIDDPGFDGSVSDLWRFTLPPKNTRVSGEYRLHKNLNLSAGRL
jgi:hypothetical protein